MATSFISRVRVGSNGVRRLGVNIRAGAQLLFVRHIEARLRRFGALSRASWGEGEYNTIFLADFDEEKNGVPVFVGWKMSKEAPISEVCIAVGTEGALGEPSSKRAPSQDEQRKLSKRLELTVREAEKLANARTTWTFDVAFRIDGHQPTYPHKPIEFENNYVVAVPREEDADRKGWGHNPGIAVLFSTQGTDAEDALAACRQGLFERVLFWTFVSASYCRSTKALFSQRSRWPESKKRLALMRLPEGQAKRFQVYSRVRAAIALRRIRKTWRTISEVKGSERVRVLSSLAAYRTALEIQSRTYHTQSVAVVAYMAALEAVAPQPRRCSGLVVCDICGGIGEGHNLEGHLTPILTSVRSALRREDYKKAEALLRYAYRAYRSAYVHSARTPLQEYGGAKRVLDIYDPEGFWSEQSEHSLLYELDDIVHRVIEVELSQR